LPIPLTRRNFLKASAALAATGALGVAVDGTIFEPNRPRLVRLEISLSRLPEAWDGFKIAQLSDFHYDDYFSVVPIRRAIDVVNCLQPDLVVLTGDFVSVPILAEYLHNKKLAAHDAEPCASLLSRLRARLGVWAILGNHDAASDPQRIIDYLQSCSIPVLRNRSVPLEQRGARLWLSGVDDVLEGKPDLDLTLREVPQTEPVVLLAHEPDFADRVARYPVDLQLSGHSHGGQIRIPLVGAPYLPELARKYPQGLWRVGRLTGYTNVGLGTIRVPIRLACPPEISLLTLRAARASGT
jgi:predicted MPP superfamily phosphohydrolase